MKKVLLTLILFTLSAGFAFAAKNQSDTTVCFSVNPPMSCVNCENKIKTNLRYEKGIRQIDASAKDAVVTIKFDKKKTSVDKLIDAFKKIGYTAAPADACSSAPAKKCGSCCGSCH